MTKSDTKRGKQGYFSFLGTATLSEATKQVVVAGRTRGCHIGTTNKDAASGHEMATIISSFSEWLLWVLVFTNIPIDIVTIILTGSLSMNTDSIMMLMKFAGLSLSYCSNWVMWQVYISWTLSAWANHSATRTVWKRFRAFTLVAFAYLLLSDRREIDTSISVIVASP